MTAHSQEKMRVAVSLLEPWKIDRNGTLEGPEIEIVEAIAKQLNMEPEYHVLPFKRCLAVMRDGGVDIMTGLLKSEEREEYIHYINPPYKGKSNKVFYVLAGNEGLINGYQDLQHRVVGVKRGAKYFPAFDNDKKINKVEVNKYEQSINMLLDKRIDTFVITDSQGDYLLSRLGLVNQVVKAAYRYNKANKVYIGISKRSPLAGRLGKVEALVGRMIASGELKAIIEGFFIRNGLPVPDYQ